MACLSRTRAAPFERHRTIERRRHVRKSDQGEGRQARRSARRNDSIELRSEYRTSTSARTPMRVPLLRRAATSRSDAERDHALAHLGPRTSRSFGPRVLHVLANAFVTPLRQAAAMLTAARRRPQRAEWRQATRRTAASTGSRRSTLLGEPNPVSSSTRAGDHAEDEKKYRCGITTRSRTPSRSCSAWRPRACRMWNRGRRPPVRPRWRRHVLGERHLAEQPHLRQRRPSSR